jgi:hypothetical protein
LIVTVGSLLGTLVAVESARNFFNAFAGSGAIDPSVARAQDLLLTVTVATYIPIGIISALVGVIGLLIQLVLVHYCARLFGGQGTIRHLLTVLLGFYNKWFPFIYLVGYITIAGFFVTAGSPVFLCLVAILVLLTLYVTGKTSGKIAQAYDFDGARGCLAYTLSNLIIGGGTALLLIVVTQVIAPTLLEQFFRLNMPPIANP